MWNHIKQIHNTFKSFCLMIAFLVLERAQLGVSHMQGTRYHNPKTRYIYTYIYIYISCFRVIPCFMYIYMWVCVCVCVYPVPLIWRNNTRFSSTFICVVNNVSMRVNNGLLLYFIHETNIIFTWMTKEAWLSYLLCCPLMWHNAFNWP